MPHRYFSMIRESTSSSGTSDFTLTGAVTGGFRTFASVFTNGDTTHYQARNSAGQYEDGLGTYSAGVLARTYVVSNSLGTTAKINFTTVPQVYVVMPAQYGARSVHRGVSAAGTVQGDATALTAQINIVTTVGSGAGVILPASAIGMEMTIKNSGANALKIYPNSGAVINALSANAAETLATGANVTLVCSSATQWDAL